jgi:hypothetical protein
VRSGIAPAPAFAFRYGEAKGVGVPRPNGKGPARKAQRTFPTLGGAGRRAPGLPAGSSCARRGHGAGECVTRGSCRAACRARESFGFVFPGLGAERSTPGYHTAGLQPWARWADRAVCGRGGENRVGGVVLGFEKITNGSSHRMHVGAALTTAEVPQGVRVAWRIRGVAVGARRSLASGLGVGLLVPEGGSGCQASDREHPTRASQCRLLRNIFHVSHGKSGGIEE